jgi:hypothetical protein
MHQWKLEMSEVKSQLRKSSPRVLASFVCAAALTYCFMATSYAQIGRKSTPRLTSANAKTSKPADAGAAASDAEVESRSPGAAPPRQINPRELGLRIPNEGPIRQGEGRRVKVAGPQGQPVVALVHVDVADERIVIMPDGRLRVFPANEAPPTSDDFVPATQQELAASLSAEFPRFKVKTTPHYVFVYNSSEEFYTGTSSILESMQPGVQQFLKRLGLDVREPLTPLAVIMFRTREEFEALHKMPEEIAAYYDAVSNHVVLYEQNDLVEQAPELALRQAISTIAHEGVHQILHNNGVQQRLSRWPMWISEGLPEYLAPTVIDVTSIRRTLKWKGAGTVNDLRMLALDRLLKSDGSNGDDLVALAVNARELDSTGYAASWALTHFLALKHKAKFTKYLQAVSQIEPLAERGSTVVGRSADDVAKFNELFGEDHARLSKELLYHLRKLPYKDPLANQTFYVVTMVVKQGGSAQVSAGMTTSPGSVRQWQAEARQKLPAQLRPLSSFSVRTFPNKPQAQAYLDGVLRGR